MRPLIIAHRGASHLAPENTLTAFRLAKTLGADGFECDVQITRDRHLVVAHDYLTDLKTGVHGNIPDMDFDDLRQLDFGKWKSPEFAGEKIPTLEEVLEVAQDFRMIHIELTIFSITSGSQVPQTSLRTRANPQAALSRTSTSFRSK